MSSSRLHRLLPVTFAEEPQRGSPVPCCVKWKPPPRRVTVQTEGDAAGRAPARHTESARNTEVMFGRRGEYTSLSLLSSWELITFVIQLRK